MTQSITRLFTVFVCVCLPLVNSFALDATQFDDPVLLERYHTLTQELRCLVCQNETIAGSSAPLAVDLRKQVAEQINAGLSDDQIRAYMTERYGEFIHYRPPQSGATKILWFAPLLLILFAGLVFVIIVRKRESDLMDEEGA